MKNVHRENLNKLHNFILGMAPEYFSMRHYQAEQSILGTLEDVTTNEIKENMKVCLAGCGPIAGIYCEKSMQWEGNELVDIDWTSYVSNVFGTGICSIGYWLFSDNWGCVDDSPTHAAKRLRIYLDNERDLKEKLDLIEPKSIHDYQMVFELFD